MEVLKQISSTGYLRKRLPQELVVLQGSQYMGNVALDMHPASVSELKTVGDSMTQSTPMDARAKAKMQGYEGDPCGECGNYTLVRNGTCMKCNTCGSTSGCS